LNVLELAFHTATARRGEEVIKFQIVSAVFVMKDKKNASVAFFVLHNTTYVTDTTKTLSSNAVFDLKAILGVLPYFRCGKRG
jgi:hypothetical protein